MASCISTDSLSFLKIEKGVDSLRQSFQYTMEALLCTSLPASNVETSFAAVFV
jgi:hypothetical protein